MAKKEQVVQPDTVKIQGDVAIEATGDVTVVTPRNGDPAGANADFPEVELPADIAQTIKDNATPETKEVKTGKNVFTGEDVKKKVPVKKPADNYATKDRGEFEVAKSIEGSLNGRVFNLKAGDKVFLNDDEYSIFGPYLKK